MLSAGIKKTLGVSGKPDNAIVLRKGSDAELGSVHRRVERDRSSSPPPASRRTSEGKPLGVGEVVVVGAMEKLGANGVTNVTIRGVTDDVMRFRPEVHIVAGRAAQPGTRRGHRRHAHPRALQGRGPRAVASTSRRTAP